MMGVALSPGPPVYSEAVPTPAPHAGPNNAPSPPVYLKPNISEQSGGQVLGEGLITLCDESVNVRKALISFVYCDMPAQ